MATNEVLDNVISIVNLIKFKQEINENIDVCIKNLEQDTFTDNHIKRLMTQIMTYYDRMKHVYCCRRESDDEKEVDDNNEDEFMLDDDENDINDNDDSDYTNLMAGRIYGNESSKENEMRRKLLGIDFSLQDTLDENDDNNDNDVLDGMSFDFGSNKISTPIDSSVDPQLYDNEIPITQNDNSDDVEEHDNDEPGNFIIRNEKQSFKAETDQEIIIDNDDINYDDPVVL